MRSLRVLLVLEPVRLVEAAEHVVEGALADLGLALAFSGLAEHAHRVVVVVDRVVGAAAVHVQVELLAELAREADGGLVAGGEGDLVRLVEFKAEPVAVKWYIYQF